MDNTSASHHHSKKKRKIIRKICFALKAVLLAVQAIVSVMVIVSLIDMDILNNVILIVVIVALVAILIMNTVILLKHHKSLLVWQIICIVLSLMCIVGGLFVLQYTNAFNGFLNKVTKSQPEVKSYSVAVLSESEIKELSNLEQKNISFLKADSHSELAEQHLLNMIQFSSDYYDDFGTMMEVMNNSLSDAIVLESERIDVINEEIEDKKWDLEVIYTFEVELPDNDSNVSHKEITKEPFMILISGSDSRIGIKAAALSDVNMIVVVNPNAKKILLASVARDTYVQLHGTTGLKDKLTHAGLYGISMSKATIEDLLDIKIDHTVKVSFDTVVKVVDELDGIDINSDVAMTLGARNGKKCHYVEGVQHVDGECALRFARERKTYLRGDLHRVENQQQVITSIIEKISNSRDYLFKVPAILDIAADSFETSLERNDISEFIRMQLANSAKWEIESITLAGEAAMLPTYSMGANLPLYVFVPDEQSITDTRNKIYEYLNE